MAEIHQIARAVEQNELTKTSLSTRFPWAFTSHFAWIVFTIVAIIASVHRVFLGDQSFNNYVIFEKSFDHLMAGIDLYALYPNDHYDLFKYSPTFALFMAPFAMVPRNAGIILWNLLNMLLPVWAISKLSISQKQKTYILFIILIELLSSIQNSQSNGIMLGLIVGAFAYFEKGKSSVALLLICLGIYLKLFAAVAGLLFLFYPEKIKSILYGSLFMVLFAFLPLLVISWDVLMLQYESWFALVSNDPSHGQNFSIMTLLERTVGLKTSDLFFLVPGAMLLMLPLLRREQFAHYSFRLLYLCSVLIWVVVFNHKAESPTYCIALGGIAIWFVMGKKNVFRNTVMILSFLLVALSPTDLFPAFIRNEFLYPYALKALMPVILWFVIVQELLFRKEFSREQQEESTMKQTA